MKVPQLYFTDLAFIAIGTQRPYLSSIWQRRTFYTAQSTCRYTRIRYVIRLLSTLYGPHIRYTGLIYVIRTSCTLYEYHVVYTGMRIDSEAADKRVRVCRKRFKSFFGSYH